MKEYNQQNYQDNNKMAGPHLSWDNTQPHHLIMWFITFYILKYPCNHNNNLFYKKKTSF